MEYDKLLVSAVPRNFELPGVCQADGQFAGGVPGAAGDGADEGDKSPSCEGCGQVRSGFRTDAPIHCSVYK